jgi:DNA-binding MarR family transcriptional regulator
VWNLRLKKPGDVPMNLLPRSQKSVLEILYSDGALTHKDIVKKTAYSPRTVRHALKKLKEKNLIMEKMNMQDMRQIIYLNRASPDQKKMIPGFPAGLG